MDPRAHPVSLDELLAHGEWVRALARHLVVDANAADDVEQRTWLAAIRRPPPRRGNLRAWLARVVRRQTSDGRRGEARRARHEARAPVARAAADPAEVVARAELGAQVARAVLSLEEPYRSTILLRHYEGLPVAEVAVLHAVPEATVRTRLARGVALLRERLGTTWGARPEEVRSRLGLLAGLGAWPTGAWIVGTAKAKAAAAAAIGLLLLGGLAWWALGGLPERTTAEGGSGIRVDGEGGADPGGPTLAGRPDAAAPRDPSRAEPTSEDGLVVYPALARAPARLVGVVLDAERRPVAGATVEARSSSGAEFPLLRVGDDRRHRRTAETDADGRFVLEGLLAGPYLVQARRGDARSERYDVVARAEPRPIGLWIAEPDAEDTLRVRVVDAAGRPVAGAEVRVEAMGDGRTILEDGALRVSRTGLTDAQGVVSWPELGRVQATVLARSPLGLVGAARAGRSPSLIAAPKDEVVVEVGPAGAVEGTVASGSGEPVEGATVELRSGLWGRGYWSGLSRAWTAPVVGGRYVVEGLPAGDYSAAVRGGGWTSAVEWLDDDRYPAPPTVTVAAGSRTRLDLEAERGGTIEGRVVGPSGPVPGAWVRAVRDPRTGNEPDGVNLAGANVWRLDSSFMELPDHPLLHHRVVVARDGTYRVEGLRPGAYRVEVAAPGHTFVQRIGQEVRLDAPLTLDVALVPAGVLQGAVPGATYLGVRRPGSETCEAVAILPASGLFTFPGLAPGDYELVSVYWGWETVVYGRARVEVGRTTWVDLWNSGAHGAEGRLLLAGEPLAAATAGRGWGDDAVRVGEDGRFRLRWGRPGGDSNLSVSRSLPGGGVQTWKVEGLPLNGSGETDVGDVELGRERLVVEVLDADGRPADVPVVVQTEPRHDPAGPVERKGLRVTSGVRARTDAEGRLAVDGLAAGMLCVVEAKFAPPLVLKASVELPASAPLRLVAPRMARLVVVVRTAAGEPVAGAHVWLRSWTDRTEVPSAPEPEGPPNPALHQMSARTDGAGRAVLPAVPAGAVEVVAYRQEWPSPTPAPRAAVRLLLAAGEDREIEARLP